MIAQELEVSLHMAFMDARQKRHEFITVEHLLLALLDNPSASDKKQRRAHRSANKWLRDIHGLFCRQRLRTRPPLAGESSPQATKPEIDDRGGVKRQ